VHFWSLFEINMGCGLIFFISRLNCHSYAGNNRKYHAQEKELEASMSLKISRRHFGHLLLGSALSTGFAPLAKADDGAGVYVQKLGAEVIRLANGGTRGDKALQRKFANLFTRYINIQNVAGVALGLNRKALPIADKAMFYDLVANYAAALFVWFVEDFKGDHLNIESNNQQGQFSNVETTIKSGGLGGENLVWRVTGSNGNYRIADLRVKGVWLTISMKKLFADTLKSSHGDFNVLYEKLREAETW
jgi:phospholipid transport system substrate-binding protein